MPLAVATPEIETAGYQAARDGVKWWRNPHPGGSPESYQWDQGHTRFRRENPTRR